MHPVNVGSRDPRALERRRTRVAKIIEVRAQGEDEEDYEELEASADDEDNSYDPGIVDKHDSWIYEIRFLGRNASSGKAFLSGPASYDDKLLVEVLEVGDDPNQPEDVVEFCCYAHDQEIYEWAVFPFHEVCFDILSLATTAFLGFKDLCDLDKDVLYSTMCSCLTQYRSMALDYGDVAGADQDWQYIPGEEHTVVNPGTEPAISQYLTEKLVESNEFRVTKSTLNFNQDQAKDPFGKLPYELLLLLFDQLSDESIMALMAASKLVRCHFRYNAKFWRRRIRSEMQWFWELDKILEEVEGEPLDYQRIYYFLNWMTTPTFGMRGPLIGVANRRRIWSTCQQIAPLYCGLHCLQRRPFRTHMPTQ